MILSRFEIDDHSCGGRGGAEIGGSDGNNGSAIHDQTLTGVGNYASGKIENQPIWMLECAYFGSDERTERDFHLDIVAAFSGRDSRDSRRRAESDRVHGFL